MSDQTALGRSPVREEPQHTHERSKPCRPDRIRQFAGQGRATTHIHIHTQQTLPARPHSAVRRSGKSHNTHTCTHTANPAGQTTLGRSPVREEPQHTYTRSKPCRSGKSHNTHTHAANPAGQGRATTHIHTQQTQPVREEPQHTYTRSKRCRPDHTRQVAGQEQKHTYMYINVYM